MENLNNENPENDNLNNENRRIENLNNTNPLEKPPVSQRKREANRRNAQKSTGPLSVIGKCYSRTNAMTHSLYAEKARVDLCREDRQEFADICSMIKFELSASGILESIEAERIAMFHWKLIRLWRYETSMIGFATQKVLENQPQETGPRRPKRAQVDAEIDREAVPHPMILDVIHRAQRTAEKGLNDAYKRFRGLQKWRHKVKLTDSNIYDADGDVVI